MFILPCSSRIGLCMLYFACCYYSHVSKIYLSRLDISDSILIEATLNFKDQLSSSSMSMIIIITWKYLLYYWPFVKRIHWSPVVFSPTKGSNAEALMVNWMNGCQWILIHIYNSISASFASSFPAKWQMNIRMLMMIIMVMIVVNLSRNFMKMYISNKIMLTTVCFSFLWSCHVSVFVLNFNYR